MATTTKPESGVYLSPRRLVFVGGKADFATFRQLLRAWPPATPLRVALRELRGGLLALAATPTV
jgi:hypothetical protein